MSGAHNPGSPTTRPAAQPRPRMPEPGTGPWLMGIVNVTPDSLSDGGRFLATERAVAHGLELCAAGPHILDVGGESTRPGADPVSPAEQIDRGCPGLAQLRRQSEVLLSVDTTRAEVARAAVAAGADWINDTSALDDDPELAAVAAQAGTPVVLMHRPHPPRTMQDDPRYTVVVDEVVGWLEQRVARAQRAGIARDRIVLDPGIGFGKRLEHNLELMAAVRTLRARLGLPLLLGPSRKSFLGQLLGRPVDQRLAGTAGAVAWLALAGVAVLRVHDVGFMADVVRTALALRDRAQGAGGDA